MVATYRPDELHHRGRPLKPFLSELERSGRAERIDLEPLGRAELADQLGAIVGSRPAAATVDRIFDRCEGNSFFAEELLATADTDATADLPGSLREALLLRIERLAPATQEVLRAAAVVGDPSITGCLRECQPPPSRICSPPCARRRGITCSCSPVTEWPRRFATRSCARPSMTTPLPAALGASLRAAAEAERMHAYTEAVGHIERALSIWDRIEDAGAIAGMGLVELLLRCAEMAEFAGHAERALALGERARDAVDAAHAPWLAAAAEARIGRALWLAGRGDDAIARLAEVRRLVPAEPPSIQRADALAQEGRALMLAGRGRDARGALEEALELATRLSAPDVQASALSSLAIVYGLIGDMERAIASGRQGLTIATEFELPLEVMRAYVNGSQAIDDAGRMQEALELGLEGIEAARRLGQDRSSGDQLRVQAAWRLARMGRFAEAEVVIKPAMEAARTPFNVAASKGISGHLAAERGQFALAEELLYESSALAQRSGGFQIIGPTQAWIVSLHLWRGELDTAIERVGEGLARLAKTERHRRRSLSGRLPMRSSRGCATIMIPRPGEPRSSALRRSTSNIGSRMRSSEPPRRWRSAAPAPKQSKDRCARPTQPRLCSGRGRSRPRSRIRAAPRGFAARSVGSE